MQRREFIKKPGTGAAVFRVRAKKSENDEDIYRLKWCF
jgi:hypothetical protein